MGTTHTLEKTHTDEVVIPTCLLLLGALSTQDKVPCVDPGLGLLTCIPSEHTWVTQNESPSGEDTSVLSP